MVVAQSFSGFGFVQRALTLGYANSRVKAMKTSLLSNQELFAMVEANSLEEINALLEKTSYREHLVSSAWKERSIADRIE